MTSSALNGERDDVSISSSSSLVLIGVTGVIGAVVLAVVPRVSGLLLDLPWVPFEGPLRLLQRVADHLSWPLLGLIGLTLGVLAGWVLRSQTVRITLDDREIVVTEGSTRSRFARAQVDRALVRGNRLVLRDAQDVDLIDTKAEASGSVLVDALSRHGWPVQRSD